MQNHLNHRNMYIALERTAIFSKLNFSSAAKQEKLIFDHSHISRFRH